MANETKTDSNSTAKVGDGGQVSRLRKLSFGGTHKKRTPIILLTVLVLVIGWVIFGAHIGQKVYAQAAGHKIYKQDVQNLIGNNKGISDHQAATVLANMYLVESMAKDQGVTVSDQDIEAQYGPGINSQKVNNKYSYQNKVNQLYFAKLSAYNRGAYKGKLLITNFSRYVPYKSPLLAEEKAANPKLGNPAAIARDKKYAQNLITKLYNQIQSGKITFDQAIEIEHNDPVVGKKVYPTLPHSNSFDTSLYPSVVIDATSSQQQIGAIKSGQTSKPFVVKVSNSINNDSTADSYFLVVRMDKASGGHSNMTFEQYLNQAEKRLGYKVYV